MSAVFIGALIKPPERTLARMSFIASSTTTLPAVLPVISSACSSGTPAESRADSVRDQRASATLLHDVADLHRDPQTVPAEATTA